MSTGAIVVLTGVLLVLGAGVAAPRWSARRNRRRYDVREVRGFLSDEECAHLIECARPMLRTSGMLERGVTSARARRASATAFLDQRGDPTLQAVKRRIAELTGLPVEHQEKLQVTYYGASDRYDPHYDSLCASGGDPGPAGDRSCTVILYLNDDYRGGSTWFPRIRRRIRAEKGKALVFTNLSLDGESAEPLSLHAGEAVRAGEKWISNQWIRRRPRQPSTAGNRKSRRARSRR